MGSNHTETLFTITISIKFSVNVRLILYILNYRARLFGANINFKLYLLGCLFTALALIILIITTRI